VRSKSLPQFLIVVIEPITWSICRGLLSPFRQQRKFCVCVCVCMCVCVCVCSGMRTTNKLRITPSMPMSLLYAIFVARNNVALMSTGVRHIVILLDTLLAISDRTDHNCRGVWRRAPKAASFPDGPPSAVTGYATDPR